MYKKNNRVPIYWPNFFWRRDESIEIVKEKLPQLNTFLIRSWILWKEGNGRNGFFLVYTLIMLNVGCSVNPFVFYSSLDILQYQTKMRSFVEKNSSSQRFYLFSKKLWPVNENLISLFFFLYYDIIQNIISFIICYQVQQNHNKYSKLEKFNIDNLTIF